MPMTISLFSASVLPWIAVGLSVTVGLWLAVLVRRRGQARDEAWKALDQVAEVAGLLIAQVDLEGRWQRVPQGLCALLGRADSELLGRPLVECLHPEDREAGESECGALLKGERLGCALEARVLRPGGDELWMQINGAPVRTKMGQLESIRIILRDISRIRAIAQSLKDSEDKFRTLSDYINCGVFLYTDVFHFVNPGMEAITGYGAEELLGQPIWKPVHPDEQGLVRERGEARRRGEEVPNRYVLKLRHKDGRTIYADFIARAVTLGGKVYGLGTAFDITDRVVDTENRLRLERQILEAQKLESLGLLAGGIAHDFNNLLTVILGNASILVEEAPPRSLLQACAATVVETCHRASDLTRQMLAYSGKGRFVMEPTDLNACVTGITSLMDSALPKLITLRHDLGQNLPGIHADRSQLQQVVLNLVTNAGESMGGRGGSILVRTGFQRLEEADVTGSYKGQDLAPGPYVCLDVTDSGSGMDEATQAHIFEPFFTTKGSGRGLGLAAIQGIVRGHKGGIWIYSAPGKGTTFRVLFPALDAPVAAAVERAGPLDDWRGSGLVLVVDDEESIRIMAATALQRVGFDVLQAGNGREGIDVFRSHARQLRAVLLDLVMPVMGGEAALEEMLRIAPGVPVILSSGYEGDSRISGAASGRPFLQKPYTVTELVEKVRGAVQ
ncbi:MAG: PAS domain S-box protein [Acidobacteriota bacterium]|nr:PAS domain S-box protein [Acidobacteriota bacterium]